jgi:hypothetical protein
MTYCCKVYDVLLPISSILRIHEIRSHYNSRQYMPERRRGEAVASLRPPKEFVSVIVAICWTWKQIPVRGENVFQTNFVATLLTSLVDRPHPLQPWFIDVAENMAVMILLCSVHCQESLKIIFLRDFFRSPTRENKFL